MHICLSSSNFNPNICATTFTTAVSRPISLMFTPNSSCSAGSSLIAFGKHSVSSSPEFGVPSIIKGIPVGPSHIYERLHLLVNPFRLCRMLRTYYYQILRVFKRFLYLVSQHTRRQLRLVAEHRAYLFRQVLSSVQVGRKLVVLEFTLKPLSPFLVVAFVADKCVVVLIIHA